MVSWLETENVLNSPFDAAKNGAGADDLGGLPAYLLLQLGTSEQPMQSQLLDKI